MIFSRANNRPMMGSRGGPLWPRPASLSPGAADGSSRREVLVDTCDKFAKTRRNADFAEFGP